MNISEIIGDGVSPIFLMIILNCILIPRYSRRITTAALWGGGILMAAVYLAVRIGVPGLSRGELLISCFSIPEGLLFYGLSKVRGHRFWLGFCSLGLVELALTMIVGLSVNLLCAPIVLYPVFCIVVNLFHMRLFHKIGDRIREISRLECPGWKRASLAVAMTYVFTYLLILYPQPLGKRLEYTPVILGFSLLILACVSVLYLLLGEIYKEKRASRNEDRMRRKLERMQMRLMVSQMKPHFVANSMNAIKVLIKKDPKKAADMVTNFSNYLRANIDGIEMKELIPFGEELEHIRAYLSIQQMRFAERLEVVYDIRVKDFFLPPLSVEPLVENAVHHGISPKEEGGTVTVRSWSENGMYRISVEDNGVGFDVRDLGKRDSDDSVGLAYVSYSVGRIEGAKYEIQSKPGYGTKVLLSLPWEEV